jgi:dihydropteroate synthase
MGDLAPSPPLGLSGRALELAPRAAPPGPGLRSAHGEVARIAFRASALAPELRRRLDVELGPPPARTHAIEEVRELPVTLLRRLAAEHPDAALLLDAWASAAAPPPRPRVMGVLNVTPDSFSDGGRFDDPGRAVDHALEMVAEGAEVLDVGGESTRPGSLPVPTDVECDRVLPVIRRLAKEARVPLSIDTTKAEVARRAVELGASWINDTSAGRDDAGMLGVAAATGATFVCMHRLGTPADMQRDPGYEDPVREVADFLRLRAAACLQAGIEAPKILVDPGIGFGKRLEHNLELLRRLVELRSLGLPLLLGVSRKAFIGQAARRSAPEAEQPTASDRPADRIGGTAAAVTAGVLAGASVLRVHDVAAMVQAIRVAQAIGLEPPHDTPRAGTP